MVQITDPLDFINGLFSLIVVITSFVISFLVLMKFRKLKAKEFLYWGIAFMGMYGPWWPASISFLMVLTTGTTLPLCYYNIIGVMLLPIFLELWIFGFHEMQFPEKRKITIPLYAIIFILAEIYIFYHFFTGNCEVLATFQPGLFDVKLGTINVIYHMFIIISVSIIGLLVANNALKSKNRELRIKGFFLTYAFIALPICGFLDAGLSLGIVALILVRLAMVAGAICFYIGLFIPTFIKKLLKIEN